MIYILNKNKTRVIFVQPNQGPRRAYTNNKYDWYTTGALMLTSNCMCRPSMCIISIYILGRHMQFDVNIRLYEYWHEQVKIRKKRKYGKMIRKITRNIFWYIFWIFKTHVICFLICVWVSGGNVWPDGLYDN
jgi:hypothetical protein